MSDPISGAGGGAAKMALQEMMKQQQQQQLQNQMTNPAGQTSVFQQKMSSIQQPQQVQQVAEMQKTHQASKTRSIRDMAGINQPQRVNATQKGQHAQFAKTSGNQGGMAKGLAKFIHGTNTRKSSLDKMIKQALQGKNFNNKELLVLQYKVSTYSLEMDLTSKVVDKATGGIKQAMNTQV